MHSRERMTEELRKDAVWRRVARRAPGGQRFLYRRLQAARTERTVPPRYESRWWAAWAVGDRRGAAYLDFPPPPEVRAGPVAGRGERAAVETRRPRSPKSKLVAARGVCSVRSTQDTREKRHSPYRRGTERVA